MRASVNAETGWEPFACAAFTPESCEASATANQTPTTRTMAVAEARATFQMRWKWRLSRRCATTSDTKSATRAKAARATSHGDTAVD